jgi:hypothetical protein
METGKSFVGLSSLGKCLRFACGNLSFRIALWADSRIVVQLYRAYVLHHVLALRKSVVQPFWHLPRRINCMISQTPTGLKKKFTSLPSYQLIYAVLKQCGGTSCLVDKKINYLFLNQSNNTQKLHRPYA